MNQPNEEIVEEWNKEFLQPGGIFFKGAFSPHDILNWWIKKLENAQEKQTEYLMKYLYSKIQDDYIECSIDYFLRDQAEIMKIKLD